jgi:hypothetical protein
MFALLDVLFIWLTRALIVAEAAKCLRKTLPTKEQE